MNSSSFGAKKSSTFQFQKARAVIVQLLVSRFAVAVAAMICGAFLLPGCGGNGAELNRAEVSGDVTVNGAPLEEGSIAFLPTEGTQGPSVGGTINQGRYLIPVEEGPVVGTYRVEIRATRETGRKIEAGPPSPPGTMIDEVKAFIPAKYNAKSTLTAEIKSGTNESDYDLRIDSD